MAQKFAKKFINTIVYALTCNLSYSYQNAFWGDKYGYYARPSSGKNGYWKYYQYYYVRGKLKLKSDYMYYYD